jgi:hypothetical protein
VLGEQLGGQLGAAHPRQLEVDDGDVRPPPADDAARLLRVVGDPHDVVAVLAQQQLEPAAERKVVLDDHDVDPGLVVHPHT